MVELVYHDPSDRTGVSPFDKVIREITEDEEVLLACPYIGSGYLEEVTEKTDNWFLLTDVAEWLSIHGRLNREAIHEFLVDHSDHVRHVPDLHAKVVVGGNRALVGSANFTTKGLTGRTEMSVLIDETGTIRELTEWFETLWSIYDPPDIDRVEKYIETASSTPTPAQNQSSVTFSSGESPGKASLASTDSDVAVDPELEDNHDKLVQTVSKAPSPEWIYSYFGLAEDLLSKTDLSNDDPRLLMSLPEAGTLPITVNNRYALVAFRGGQSRTEFILPPNSEKAKSYLEKADRTGRFDPIYSEDEAERPWFVGFDGLPDQAVDDEFRDLWMTAVKQEMERAEKSPYRRFHQPVVYKAVRDHDYRKKVIRDAFG